MAPTISCTYLQTHDDGADEEEFEEMMDQLLERDGAQDPSILAEASFDVDEDNRHDSQVRQQSIP